ncbi:MAG: UDP-N-acetylmuramoyl-L-alanine--D-glutamate ligase [Bacteroidia bacterium]|nr:UDP-N-acetylmuramoyl-L-alanine--D-glutamate ligase [Bacteroidia bacterium]
MRVAILGAGESGTGAAVLAQVKGAQVWLSDAGRIQDAYRQTLHAYGIAFEEGSHTEQQFLEADIVVKSPGIPGNAPFVRMLRAAGKHVISEIEFAARHTTAQIVALTGTNGKTTTTSLVHHLLTASGYRAALGGNIGKSFAMLAATENPDWYVLEISSFQLDDIVTFSPRVAVLLNITPDHLDRYDGMDAYAAAKFRITENQLPTDAFIHCLEDPETQARIGSYAIRARQMGYRLDPQPGAAAWMEGSRIVIGGREAGDFSRMQLIGRHNQLNTLAAVLAAHAAGVSLETIAAALPAFAPVPHRLEPVASIGGVQYINDSKATNVDAVYYALEGMRQPIVWIAGGVDKGNDYQQIASLVEDKVKEIVVLGSYIGKFRSEFRKPVHQAMSMPEAVRMAQALAAPGDAVLLSPACASFDLFRNYEDRGDQFRAAVLQLTSGTPQTTE